MKRSAVWPVFALGGALAIGFIGIQERQPIAAQPANAPREADIEAITKSARDFEAAFAKGDAKGIAVLWTDQAECEEAGGALLQGKQAIEKAYSDTFKEKKQGKLEVEIRSIRFPARDLAIEEGFLRHTPAGAGLPSSTLYTATHVREEGKWLLATSREYGAGQDRLGDLAFLIGKWQGGPKGQETALTFDKDPVGPFILGTFSRQLAGKASIKGTMRIGLDVQRGQIRSWHFDADGGQGQCLWLRDGNNWVLDAQGETGDGTNTAAVNLLTRLGADEITWRSIDRLVGNKPLPDTDPIKLTRVIPK